MNRSTKATCAMACATLTLLGALLGDRGIRSSRSSAPAQATSEAAPLPTMEVLAQVGGRTRGVAIDGDLAFIGVGPRVAAYDISDPSRPRWTGQSEPLAERVLAIGATEGHLWVTLERGLMMVLERGPGGALVEVGNPMQDEHGDDFRDLIADPSRVIVATDRAVWELDPTEPLALPRRIEAFDGLVDIEDIALRGSRLAAQGDGRLRVVDLDDAGSPSRWEARGPFDSGVALFEDLVVVVAGRISQPMGIQVFTFDDDGGLDFVSELSLDAWTRALYAYEDASMLVLTSDGLLLVDLSDPLDPRVQRTVVRDSPGGLSLYGASRPGSVAIRGPWMLATPSGSSAVVIDLRSEQAEDSVAEISHPDGRNLAEGRTGYALGDHEGLWWLPKPLDPGEAGGSDAVKLAPDLGEWVPAFDGPRLLAFYGDHGMREYVEGDDGQPRLVADHGFRTLFLEELTACDDYLLGLAHSETEPSVYDLVVLDIPSGRQPIVQHRFFSIGGSRLGRRCVDGALYMTQDGWLKIFDMRQPERPRLRSQHFGPDLAANSIVASPGWLFLLWGDEIVSIPADPSGGWRLDHRFRLDDGAKAMEAERRGDHLVVLTEDDLRLLELREHARYASTARTPLPGYGDSSLVISTDTASAALRESGLWSFALGPETLNAPVDAVSPPMQIQYGFVDQPPVSPDPFDPVLAYIELAAPNCTPRTVQAFASNAFCCMDGLVDLPYEMLCGEAIEVTVESDGFETSRLLLEHDRLVLDRNVWLSLGEPVSPLHLPSLCRSAR